jgi:hypothetical protein
MRVDEELWAMPEESDLYAAVEMNICGSQELRAQKTEANFI